MTVRELIKKLMDYNMEADVNVIVHCRPENFAITCGSAEGVQKINCDDVSFYVDRLCEDERSKGC